MKKLLMLTAMTLISVQAWAIELNDAKQQGLIGERSDGYLGYVVEPAADEVKVLVKTINGKRKASYHKIAEKNGLTLEQVLPRVGKKTRAKTKSGNYFQDSEGAWIKK